MSRRHDKGKVKLSPFVPILIEELDSPAFRDMLPTALKVYCHFKRIDGILKKKSGNTYNGLFSFTYTEAEKYGFGSKTFSRAIEDLNDKGFIDVIDSGGLRGNCHSNAKYRLSERWRQYGRVTFDHRPRYPQEPVRQH